MIKIKDFDKKVDKLIIKISLLIFLVCFIVLLIINYRYALSLVITYTISLLIFVKNNYVLTKMLNHNYFKPKLMYVGNFIINNIIYIGLLLLLVLVDYFSLIGAIGLLCIHIASIIVGIFFE